MNDVSRLVRQIAQSLPKLQAKHELALRDRKQQIEQLTGEPCRIRDGALVVTPIAFELLKEHARTQAISEGVSRFAGDTLDGIRIEVDTPEPGN